MSTKPIVIIGAGFAGLSAALDLHRAGRQIVVLEADSRVGGRVRTLRDFSNGRLAEAGGELINPEHHRIQSLVAQFGLSLEEVPRMSDWFSWLALEGKVGAADDWSVWGVRLDEEITKIDEALADLGKAIFDPANPQQIAEAERLDQMSVRVWLESLDIHPLALKAVASRLQAEFLVEPSGHSTLDLARWGSLTEIEGVDGPTTHILGGNEQLPKAMAAELPDVRLQTIVKTIEQRAEGVLIGFEQDGRMDSIMAEEVIVAVPLNAMRSIQFEPPLPAEYQRAIQQLHLGPVTKVLLEYERPFWEDVGWTGLLLTDLPMNCIWLTAGGQVGDGGMLTVYTGGHPAIQYSEMADEDRIADVLSQIETLFPGSSAFLKSSKTIAWRNERFFGGGYAIFPPGSVVPYYAAMRQPHGRVHFAGEHTAIFQGYMEGAIETGQRAAAEVLAI